MDKTLQKADYGIPEKEFRNRLSGSFFEAAKTWLSSLYWTKVYIHTDLLVD